jgi:Ca-activated chloride channel family protein
MTPIEAPFLSNDYLELAQSRPDLAAALALGERVIVVVDGKAYRTIQEGQASTPIPMPATAAPQEPTATRAPVRATGLPGATPTTTSSPKPTVCGVAFLPLGGVFALWLMMRSKQNKATADER